MKILYSWIKELVPKMELTASELAQLLTLHSYETTVERSYEVDPAITVVKILAIEKHPNADRLQLAVVTDGAQEFRVVCGAPNIAQGQVVPFAPPGAKVYDEDGKPFVIKEAEIRGVKSPGMLNSLRELGLSHDHGGIFVLPPDTPLGTKLADLIAPDTILEADILPDRAHDSLSQRGIAREVAALLNVAIEEPEIASVPASTTTVEGFSLVIEDHVQVPRYMGVVIDRIEQHATPLTMQIRLLAMGARPIAPLVDITNYVMFEIGNPSHVFDVQKLPAKTFSVVASTSSEKFQGIDGKEYMVNEGALLVQAGGTTVALAGVMGGSATQVDTATQVVLLEVATFNAYSVQRTSQELALRSESSARFSKGISIDMAGQAALRLVHLIEKNTGGVVKGVLDTHPDRAAPWVISFFPSKVSKYAGQEIDEKTIENALLRVRCGVAKHGTQWQVSVPSDRLDLQGEHDLIDEVLRLYGLENIATAVISTTGGKPLGKAVFWRESIRALLVGLGFTETYNYSFEPADLAELVGVLKHPHVRLQNPVAPELANLRFSLLPGLLANMIKNRDYVHRDRAKQERALFEIGNVYHVGEGGKVPGVVERRAIGGILVGTKGTLNTVVDEITKLLHIEGVEVHSFPKNSTFTEDSLQLTLAGEFLGTLYVLSPAILRELKYRVPLVAFELSFDALLAYAPDTEGEAVTLEDLQQHTDSPRQFVSLPKYPSVYRDLAVFVDPTISVEQVEGIIERVGGEMVAEVELFDVYDAIADATAKKNEPKKSLAFHISYQAPDKTLTAQEIAERHSLIIKALSKEVAGEVRE